MASKAKLGPSTRITLDRLDFLAFLKRLATADHSGRLSPEEDIVGRENDILGILQYRHRDKPKQPMPRRKTMQEFVEAYPQFTRPSTRSQRPMTADGRSSFHFSYAAISRTHDGKIRTPRGKVVGKGGTASHDRYIARDQNLEDIYRDLPEDMRERVLAMLAEARIETPQKETDDEGRVRLSGEPGTAQAAGRERGDSDRGYYPRNPGPERAALWAAVHFYQSSLGDADDGGETQSLHSVRHLSSIPLVHDVRLVPGIASLPLHQDEDGRVADRIEADHALRRTRNRAHGADDEGLTSVAGIEDYITQQEAQAVSQNGERILFTNISQDDAKRDEFWHLVEQSETLPAKDQITLRTGKNWLFWYEVMNDASCPDELRDALHAAEPEAPYRFKPDDGRAIRRWLEKREGWDAVSDNTDFKLGQGGRVQFRIVGEIPHEVSMEAKVEILKSFCKEFDDRGLPYTGVLHAPDHTNDDRNWHFHIAFWDRPVSRLPDGRWDFSVTKQRTNKWGNKWTRRPYRQDKVKEVVSRGWIPKLRRRLADIANDRLEREGITRRLDPRRYSEIGIHCEPQNHLGTKASLLEIRGIPTEAGVANAEREWDAFRRAVGKERERQQARIDRATDDWEMRLNRVNPSASRKRFVTSSIGKWRQMSDEASEYRMMANCIRQERDKALSRAELVQRRTKRELDASYERGGARFRVSRQSEMRRRLVVAETYHREMTEFFAEPMKKARTFDDMAAYYERRADVVVVDVEAHLELAAKGREYPEGVEKKRTAHRAKEKAKAEVEAIIKASRQQASQPEAGRTADKPQRPALDKAAMDAFIDDILKNNRRLVVADGRVFPRDRKPEDEAILTAIDYQAMNERLEGVRSRQDKLIADIIEYIDKEPTKVRKKESIMRGEVPYTLAHPSRDLRDAFYAFADEPGLRRACENAIAFNEAREQDRARFEECSRVEAERQQREAEASVQRQRQAAEIDGIFKRMAAVPVDIIKVGNKRTITASSLEAIGASESHFDSEAAQKRLAEVEAAQVNEMRVLKAYVRSNPHRFIGHENGSFELDSITPADLRALAGKWSKHPAASQEFREIIVRVNGLSHTNAAIGRKQSEEPATQQKLASETLATIAANAADISNRRRLAASLAARDGNLPSNIR